MTAFSSAWTELQEKRDRKNAAQKPLYLREENMRLQKCM
jgi:hypothetical protein